jgi:hypothetical protein
MLAQNIVLRDIVNLVERPIVLNILVNLVNLCELPVNQGSSQDKILI